MIKILQSIQAIYFSIKLSNCKNTGFVFLFFFFSPLMLNINLPANWALIFAQNKHWFAFPFSDMLYTFEHKTFHLWLYCQNSFYLILLIHIFVKLVLFKMLGISCFLAAGSYWIMFCSMFFSADSQVAQNFNEIQSSKLKKTLLHFSLFQFQTQSTYYCIHLSEGTFI